MNTLVRRIRSQPVIYLINPTTHDVEPLSPEEYVRTSLTKLEGHIVTFNATVATYHDNLKRTQV